MIYEPGEIKDVDGLRKWCVDLYQQLTLPLVTYVGDRYVWDDLRVSIASARVPTAAPPNWAQVNDDGAASTGVFAYHFDDGENVFFTVQFPHSYREGSSITPHIHFQTTTDVDPADNFKIGLEYQWVNINDDMPTDTTIITKDISTGVDSLGKHQIGAFDEVSGTGKKISSVMLCRLYRAAADSDNYGGQVIITDFDIHYQKDTHGSRSSTSK